MVVYRKVSKASQIYQPPPVPQHLFHEISQSNVALNEERTTYDQALYKLTVGVRVPRNYDIKEGGMMEKPLMPELEGAEDGKFSVEADLRDTVADLKRCIANEFPNGMTFFLSHFFLPPLFLLIPSFGLLVSSTIFKASRVSSVFVNL